MSIWAHTILCTPMQSCGKQKQCTVQAQLCSAGFRCYFASALGSVMSARCIAKVKACRNAKYASVLVRGSMPQNGSSHLLLRQTAHPCTVCLCVSFVSKVRLEMSCRGKHACSKSVLSTGKQMSHHCPLCHTLPPHSSPSTCPSAECTFCPQSWHPCQVPTWCPG